MVPIVNPTDEPILHVSNGTSYVFPPKDSLKYYKVEEWPAPVGVSPYKIIESDHPIRGSYRGPIVNVPEHIANDMRLGAAHGKGCHKLVFGSAAQDLAMESAAAAGKLRDAALAELAKYRAELEQAKAELEKRYAKSGKSGKSDSEE